ncbi:nitroreductase [Pullulanibacillus sp. KACC 23026]|uniref:nitroreductase family protein n=1 Tax=Pullulanibacillus sp. KACC 23026 TaxID=3028315 RepID=UPI0023AF32B2|nr:nitroreductase [Pullulanibacillus sp. KACC 23026]WEG14443.1 nitroreductase [Pullulanibacillus sp. KACC 23026]
MKLLDGIKSRKSIGKVKPDPVEKEKIEAMLTLATYAPNHKMTEPWRFVVLTGEGRKVLGDAYRDIAYEKAESLSIEQLMSIETAQQGKARRAPVIIGVAVSFRSEDEIERMEDRAATHAAIQNMLLGAHGMGLGAIWRSGEPMYHTRMKDAFGLGGNEEMVGLIYVGYAELEPELKPRKSFSECTTWIG